VGYAPNTFSIPRACVRVRGGEPDGHSICSVAIEGGGDFWIGEGEPPAAPVHVAFAAADRATVDKFHRAAVEAGGRDNGAPGLRPHYHAGYYAAFVIDPDGNNVEAVFHGDDR
jgi:catechol 2,3-dioxygenase-like lactoylglutathione lyase family enzyme